MQDYLVELGFVNLNDLYLTREEYKRSMRKLYRRIGNYRKAVLMAGIGLGMLASYIYDQKRRVDGLEKRLREKEETAG